MYCDPLRACARRGRGRGRASLRDAMLPLVDGMAMTLGGPTTPTTS